MTADALTLNPDLRGGSNIMLGLERIGFSAGLEEMILDIIAFAFQQVERFQTERAGVVGEDHAVYCCGFVPRCRACFLRHAVHIGSVPQYGVKQVQLTIGKLAAAGGVGVETIRYYQRRGLIDTPVRAGGDGWGGGIRRYGEDDLRRLKFIRSAQGAGFTLDEIAELLALEKSDDREQVRTLTLQRVAMLDEKIAQMTEARTALMRLAKQCASTQAGACPILQAFDPDGSDGQRASD